MFLNGCDGEIFIYSVVIISRFSSSCPLKVNDDKNDDETNAVGDAMVISIYLLFTIYFSHLTDSFIQKDAQRIHCNVPPSFE